MISTESRGTAERIADRRSLKALRLPAGTVARYSWRLRGTGLAFGADGRRAAFTFFMSGCYRELPDKSMRTVSATGILVRLGPFQSSERRRIPRTFEVRAERISICVESVP